MHNATVRSNQNQEGRSLLNKEQLLTFLQLARLRLEQNGSLTTILMTSLHTGEVLVDGVQLPDDFVQKCLLLKSIGRKIREEHGGIREAVLVAETWYIDAHGAPNATRYRPSQHPCRQEAITIMGRGEDKGRTAIVIQTFTRDEHNAPVWLEPHINVVAPGEEGMAARGILDYLFDDSP